MALKMSIFLAFIAHANESYKYSCALRIELASILFSLEITFDTYISLIPFFVFGHFWRRSHKNVMKPLFTFCKASQKKNGKKITQLK